MNEPIDSTKIEKILITRTDRIGDVVLSTPVLEAVRTRFPLATIAMIVTPATKELVDGNPNLDEVIVYDKSGLERSWLGTWRFAQRLRNRKFDIAIHLHPTNRVNWVSFFAGIPIRLGYDRKNHRLLTHVIPHQKQEGKKHEAEYNFDLLKPLGIDGFHELKTYVPLHESCYEELDQIKKEAGLNSGPFVAMNAGASCPSKMWPASRFAELADKISEKFGLTVVFIGGEKEKIISAQMMRWMKTKPVDLTARLTLSQLAWLLKEADLLVSNDSGPVHIANAVGTPAISIFGRKQPGLSPKRWGPIGMASTVLHKDAGCTVCIAHECEFSFLCLDMISVEEVLEAVGKYQTCINR